MLYQQLIYPIPTPALPLKGRENVFEHVAEHPTEVRVAIITIDDLAPGMMLKSNVCDRSGRLLLPAGNELTEKHLKIFRTWGVTEADIAGDDSGEAAKPVFGDDVDPAQLAEAEEAVARLFVHNDPEHPAIRELMRLCVQRRLAHGS